MAAPQDIAPTPAVHTRLGKRQAWGQHARTCRRQSPGRIKVVFNCDAAGSLGPCAWGISVSLFLGTRYGMLSLGLRSRLQAAMPARTSSPSVAPQQMARLFSSQQAYRFHSHTPRMPLGSTLRMPNVPEEWSVGLEQHLIPLVR